MKKRGLWLEKQIRALQEASQHLNLEQNNQSPDDNQICQPALNYKYKHFRISQLEDFHSFIRYVIKEQHHDFCIIFLNPYKVYRYGLTLSVLRSYQLQLFQIDRHESASGRHLNKEAIHRLRKYKRTLGNGFTKQKCTEYPPRQRYPCKFTNNNSQS